MRLCLIILFSKIPFALLVIAVSGRSNKEQKLQALGASFADVAYRAGPLFIKFAQIISVRSDVIGAQLAKGLSVLQDKVPPFSTPKALKILKQQYGGHIPFLEVEQQPVASASVAQVYRGITKDNQKIAIKILRPNIEAIFNRDIRLLQLIIKIIFFFISNQEHQFSKQRIIEILESFKQIIAIETNLQIEAAATCRVLDNIAKNPDERLVFAPKVYWQYSKSKVLVTEWIDGMSLNEYIESQPKKSELESIAKKLSVSFFKQAFEDGLFHADIHPGNIIIDKHSKIFLIDFGITGFLNRRDRMYVAMMIHGFITRDYDMVSKLHFDAGYIDDTQDAKLFSLACQGIGEPIMTLPIGEISASDLLKQLFKMAELFQMKAQPQLILLQKTLAALEGIVHNICPHQNLWNITAPYIKIWAKKNMGFKKVIQDIKEQKTGLCYSVSHAAQKLKCLTDDISQIAHLLKEKKDVRAPQTAPKIFIITIIAIASLVFYSIN